MNSASSGIALSIAGIVTEGNRRKSERLHQDLIAKNEVIMLKGHNVQYGAPVETMIYLAAVSSLKLVMQMKGKRSILKMPLAKIRQLFFM